MSAGRAGGLDVLFFYVFTCFCAYLVEFLLNVPDVVLLLGEVVQIKIVTGSWQDTTSRNHVLAGCTWQTVGKRQKNKQTTALKSWLEKKYKQLYETKRKVLVNHGALGAEQWKKRRKERKKNARTIEIRANLALAWRRFQVSQRHTHWIDKFLTLRNRNINDDDGTTNSRSLSNFTVSVTVSHSDCVCL